MASEKKGGGDYGFFEISIKGSEPDRPALEEITKFLYEFNLLYELSRLVLDERYGNYSITHATSARVVNRLGDRDKLYLYQLTVNSPLNLNLILNASEVALTAIGVVLTGIGLRRNRNHQGDDQISFTRHAPPTREPDNRAIVLADAGLQISLPALEGEFRDKLVVRKATKHYERTKRRLEESPVRVEEVTVTYTRETKERER